jgi:hypothetical protein
VCGLPLALSVILSEAMRRPVAVGVNVTLTVQLAPAATVLAQVLVSVKSPEFVPPMTMLEMLREALPVFESVTPCAVLVDPTLIWPKVRLAGDSVISGPDAGGVTPPTPPPQATQTPATSNPAANIQPAGCRCAVAHLISIANASSPANSRSHARGGRKLGGTVRGTAGVVAPTWPVSVHVYVAVTEEEAVTLTDKGEIVQDIAG